MTNLSILAFAYSCEPGKGSEPGAGWAFAQMLARLGEAWVITRANNASAIEPVLRDLPEARRLHFVYVDLPAWARFWKKGGRGVRLYYLLWQFAALHRARKLVRSRKFDLAWHVTIANVWLGSVASLSGPPFVYGPVGGGGAVPFSLLSTLGIRGLFYEVLRALASRAGRHFNPLARVAWRRAELILVQNRDTLTWLPSRHRHKAVVFQNVVVPAGTRRLQRPHGATPTALFAGRLLAWKGVALAVMALEHLPEWRLLICGSGPDRKRLERLARRRGLHQRIEFLGWVPREELQRRMAEEADVFLFPSLHEQGGWVIAEAHAAGLPSVCVDRGGPRELGGILVAPQRPKLMARALAEAVDRALRKPVPRTPDPIVLERRLAELAGNVMKGR